MKYSNRKVVSDAKGNFDRPEQLPDNPEQEQQWQKANKDFWENHSMRYDWEEEINYAEFSLPFYEEIDKRFLSAVWETMPWQKTPFEQWIDFDALHDQEVLEIGVGNGTHAQLIASHAKSYTGIDLTEYAQKSTSLRLELLGIRGAIIQMDAQQLQFENNSFDFVWSWGVIHHSANTATILNEISRVLKPGGKSVIMVYYRSWWSYYLGGILLGLFKGQFFKGKSIHQVNQGRTDGALARYYSFRSWEKLVKPNFKVNRIESLGNKGDLLPIPGGGLKKKLEKIISTRTTHFLLQNLRMGSFLICELEKL